MDADYDVRVPNDYNEIREVMRTRREAVKQMARAQEAEEALKKSGDYMQQDEEEYESDSEEEDLYRRNKMGRFAPPAMYNQANNSTTVMAATLSRSPPPPPLQSLKWYDDDDDEKPYLSPPPRPQLVAPLSMSLAPTLALTGEEAYQRRLAMSQSLVPPSTSVKPIDSSTKTDDAIPPSLSDLATRAAAAAAVAARLAKAAPTSGPTSGPTHKSPLPSSFVTSTAQSGDTNVASFAEDLMKKQGWKKGEALGVEGNKGILDPILAEKVEVERRKLARSGERPQYSNRGTFINGREEERRNEEREKYGTVSVALRRIFMHRE